MDQFIATANPLVEQIQRSIANNRYSGLDLIRVVANSVTRTGVCYFPVLPDRISNIGVYDKYFVLVYADKPSHVVVDVKRMNADGTLLRYVMDMMVFFMCLPFVGFPSMSPLELVENASTAWKGITNKKNGRRAPPYYVYDKDLSAVLIPLQKQLDFTDIIVMSSFSSSSFGEDGTAWCDVREGIMPLLVPSPILSYQQQMGAPGGLFQEPPYQQEQQNLQLQQFGGFQQQMIPADTIPSVNVDDFDILDSLNQQQLNSLWSVA